MALKAVLRINFGLLKSNRYYSQNINLSGIIPPIITNFHEDGSVDIVNQLVNLDKYKNIGFKGYVVFGTNGENVLLTQEEKNRIMKEIRQKLPNDILIAGVKAESTQEAIHQAQQMIKFGANALLVGGPTIYKSLLSDNDLIRFFHKIADSSSVPIVIYNMPSAFGIDLSADILISLSQHSNIIGYKESGGDVTKMSKIAYETKCNHFQVLAGGAGYLLPSMIGGCEGGICGLGNVIGDQLVQLYNLIKTNNLKDAVSLQARMIKPNFLITRKYGVSGLKYAMELFGYHGGLCRAPLGSLSNDVKEEIQNSFETNGFL